MSSCTNSSNIRSTLLSQIIRETADGKRVAFTINSTEVGVTLGVTAGSVIRFDVAKDRYELSKADDPTTAEVVGVVESISGNNYTVVANGLMIYPGITAIINAYTGGCAVFDTGTGGGGGGADIFFLSDGCDGKLQLIEPKISGHIVKPVMQRVKVGPAGAGQYNAIVLNYIGYEVAEDATSSLADSFPAGEMLYFTNPPSDGWLDATTSYLLSVADNQELFSAFGTVYGNYREEITLVNTGSLPTLLSLVNSTIVQYDTNGGEYSSGTVISANDTTKKLVVNKDAKQPEFKISFNVKIGKFSFAITQSEVTYFSTPTQDSVTKEVTNSDGSKTSITQKPYIRTNSNITKVYIPSTLTVDKIICDDIVTLNQSVGSSITDFESRISTIEKKLGIGI